MSNQRCFATHRSTTNRNRNDNRGRSGYSGRGSNGYWRGRQRSDDCFTFGKKNDRDNKKHKRKRVKWRKATVNTTVSSGKTLSKKVMCSLNHLETIFKFLNFFDLVSVGSLLSKYHYNVIFFNQENVLTLQSKCKDNDNTNNRYPNKTLEVCFKNTFKNLVQLVIEPSKNNSLPNLTIGHSKNKSGINSNNYKDDHDVRFVQVADKTVKKIKFDYNKKEIYSFFSDWFYLMKKIVESNVMFVQYGHNGIISKIRKVDEYKNTHQQWEFQVNTDESTYNLCLLLAIGDASFVQYWLTKVKMKQNMINRLSILSCCFFCVCSHLKYIFYHRY